MTPFSRRTLVGPPLGATATVGCLGEGDPQDHDGNGTGDLGDPTTEGKVGLTDTSNYVVPRKVARLPFEPAIVHLGPGGTVRWQTEGHEAIDGQQHSTTAYHPDRVGSPRIPDGAAPWKSGPCSKGDSYEHPFEGERLDDCQLCLSREMLGTVLGWLTLPAEPDYRHNVGRLPGPADPVLRGIDRRTERAVLG